MARDYSKLPIKDGNLVIEDGKLAYKDCGTLYRQARLCPASGVARSDADTLVDVWMTDADATDTGGDAFKVHSGDELCYYFDLSDGTAGTPGTLYTADEIEIQGDTCDSCTCSLWSGAIVIFGGGSGAEKCCQTITRPDGSDPANYAFHGSISDMAGRGYVLLGVFNPSGTGTGGSHVESGGSSIFNGIDISDTVLFDQFTGSDGLHPDCSTPTGGSVEFGLEIGLGPYQAGSSNLIDLGVLTDVGTATYFNSFRNDDGFGGDVGLTQSQYIEGQYTDCGDTGGFGHAIVGEGTDSLGLTATMICTVINMDFTSVPEFTSIGDTGIELHCDASAGTITIPFTATKGSKSWYTATGRGPDERIMQGNPVSWARITSARQGSGDGSFVIERDAFVPGDDGYDDGERAAWFWLQNLAVIVDQFV